MSSRTPLVWFATLALVAAAQLGVSCDPGAPPTTPNTSVRLEIENVYPAGAGYFLEVSLFVDSTQPFQAIDLSVDWQGAGLSVRPTLHPDFDDDGVPFGAPLPLSLEVGPYDLVDLRHATPAPAGEVCVAQIWVFAPNGGETRVDASGALGRPDGSVAHAAPDSITYLP
jgi:hypothetical protein